MPEPFKFTKDVMRQIHRMRKSGCSLRQIGRAIGCSRTTLREHVPNLGRLRRRFGKEEERRMVEMRKRGCTFQEIAIALDCSQNTVSYHARRLGPIPLLNAGARKSRRPVPNETRKQVITLRKRGYAFERIANRLGLAPCTVRTIVITGGRPPAGNPFFNNEKIPEDKIALIIALRRAGSSYAYIAEKTGVSAAAAGKILRKNGFPGKIQLVRLAGPLGSRVRGICRVRGCGVWHYGSGLCSSHELQYRQGRIDKDGKLLPSVCENCGKKFPRSAQRRWCDGCRKVRTRFRWTLNRHYNLGYIDEQAKPLPFICQQCGKKFRRGRKTRFCEICARARPSMLRSQRRRANRERRWQRESSKPKAQTRRA